MSFSKVLLLRAFNSSRPICVPFIRRRAFEALKSHLGMVMNTRSSRRGTDRIHVTVPSPPQAKITT